MYLGSGWILRGIQMFAGGVNGSGPVGPYIVEEHGQGRRWGAERGRGKITRG